MCVLDMDLEQFYTGVEVVAIGGFEGGPLEAGDGALLGYLSWLLARAGAGADRVCDLHGVDHIIFNQNLWLT